MFAEVIRIAFFTVLAFALAMILTPIWTAFLFRHRLGKQIRTSETAPVMSALHQHKAGTPTMGGVIMWITVLGLALVFHGLRLWFSGSNWQYLDFLSRNETWLPLAAFVAAALVGMADDLFGIWRIGPKGGGLRMRHRLFLYTTISAVGAWWFYFKLGWDFLHVPLFGDVLVGPWYMAIFLLVIVATSFSLNETDGLDGLAAGTVLPAFAALAAIAFVQGRYDLAVFCGTIVGVLLAFLWFNIPPARFFMGDTGAMALGVALGIVAMLTNQALLLPVIAFVLVLESGSVILQIISKKLCGGKKIFKSSPLHHHLEALGWPEPKIVMRLWIVAGVSSVIGLILALLDRGI